MTKTILITGGAGFIGSHVNLILHQAGYQTVILDNLSSGNKKTVTKGTFVEGDLTDKSLLDKIFSERQIDAVMHFAAFIDVGESVLHPLKYYSNNVGSTIELLCAMQRHQVKTFIFSSTAALFGIPTEIPITEEHPCLPINPYGQSKLMIEKILRDLKDFQYCCLRYFNAAGGDPDGAIKNYKKKESNLIPLILRSVKSGKPEVTIFGTDYPTKDGTCVRDYIHIMDLGKAHLLAMEALLAGKPSASYNLGNGLGFTVKEVIAAAEKVCGVKIKTIEGARRAGDPPILIADSKKAIRELGWQPTFPDLEIMIAHAWRGLDH